MRYIGQNRFNGVYLVTHNNRITHNLKKVMVKNAIKTVTV